MGFHGLRSALSARRNGLPTAKSRTRPTGRGVGPEGAAVSGDRARRTPGRAAPGAGSARSRARRGRPCSAPIEDESARDGAETAVDLGGELEGQVVDAVAEILRCAAVGAKQRQPCACRVRHQCDRKMAPRVGEAVDEEDVDQAAAGWRRGGRALPRARGPEQPEPHGKQYQQGAAPQAGRRERPSLQACSAAGRGRPAGSRRRGRPGGRGRW